MRDVSIAGWSHSRFGKLHGMDVEALIADVGGNAIRHAGIGSNEIDGIFVGMYNAGFSSQDFPSSLIFQSLPGLHMKPAVRCENACASGSAAVYAARDFLAAGRGRFALVIGVEKMTDADGEQIARSLLSASYHKEEAGVPAGFAGVFGQITEHYFERYGEQYDALAAIAAKNHRNGVDNPFAHMRRDLGFDFCRMASDGNPQVAGPLKRSDCSLVSDGAAAIVLAAGDAARENSHAVRFRAAIQVNDYLPLSKRDPIEFAGAARAWRSGLAQARVELRDLSFVETHDCFTIAELIQYEAMGLTEPGEGSRAVLEGWTEPSGLLPVNRSGGLKAKGHPVGATGVSMHVMAAMQLAGEAGAMQLPEAHLGGVFNMGGAAVANYLSILERC